MDANTRTPRTFTNTDSDASRFCVIFTFFPPATPPQTDRTADLELSIQAPPALGFGDLVGQGKGKVRIGVSNEKTCSSHAHGCWSIDGALVGKHAFSAL